MAQQKFFGPRFTLEAMVVLGVFMGMLDARVSGLGIVAGVVLPYIAGRMHDRAIRAERSTTLRTLLASSRLPLA